MEYQGRIHGAAHTQWFLQGEWTGEEIAFIESYFDNIMTPQSLYFWTIRKFRTGDFEAKKIHWDRFVPKGKTVEQLVQEIRKCCKWEDT